MSARTAAKLVCDYVAPDTGQPPGERFCRAQVSDGLFGTSDVCTPGLPDGTYLWTAADARREARQLGWAVNVKIGRSTIRKDFCPDHRDMP